MTFTRRLKSACWGSLSQPPQESADAIPGPSEARHFARGADYSFPHRRTAFRPVLLLGSGSAKSCSRSEEHTSELQSRGHLVCRLLLEKKKKKLLRQL